MKLLSCREIINALIEEAEEISKSSSETMVRRDAAFELHLALLKLNIVDMGAELKAKHE